MTGEFLSTARIAGVLLAMGVLLLLVAVAVIAIQGKLDGMSAAFGGATAGRGDASGLLTIARFAIPAQILQLVGFALFCVVLFEAGERGLAVAALALAVLSSAVAVLEGTFQANVTVWAADQAARTGSAPEFFEPLRRWVNGDVQLFYMSAFLSGMLLFSWAALKTSVVPESIGWIALVWSVVAFPVYFLILGAPLLIVVSPLLFATGLLLRG